ncbi:uncharacterized protein LOC143751498 [Siphateles boraxobius]|uniref:uncharacterized protein LOC143751498 n=1 Tax=Siphateles boraxobius TaxID=180520 RepID=UPI0040636ED6
MCLRHELTKNGLRRHSSNQAGTVVILGDWGGHGVSIMPPYIMSLQIAEVDARRPPPTHTGSCSPSQHHTPQTAEAGYKSPGGKIGRRALSWRSDVRPAHSSPNMLQRILSKHRRKSHCQEATNGASEAD